LAPYAQPLVDAMVPSSSVRNRDRDSIYVQHALQERTGLPPLFMATRHRGDKGAVFYGRMAA